MFVYVHFNVKFNFTFSCLKFFYRVPVGYSAWFGCLSVLVVYHSPSVWYILAKVCLRYF